MIAPETGMKPGERYGLESSDTTHVFSGFFLDGKYFLDPQLLTAVGWLEGQQFIYDRVDDQGQPFFPERVAGNVEGLVLTLVDGGVLALSQLKVKAQAVDISSQPEATIEASASQIAGDTRRRKARLPQVLITAAAAVLLGVYAGVAISRSRR